MATYSHSKIGTYESCPQKFKFQYVDGIKGDIESVEAFVGSRVHEALEKLYDLVRNGRIPDEQLILDYYDKQWTGNWNDGVCIVKPDLKAEDYRNVGRKCVQDYYRHYQPFDQALVVALEMKVPISLDPDGQFKMIGFIDRVDKAGDGVFEIHDYKTNQSLPSQEDKDQDRQLALYEIGLRDYFGGVNQVNLVWHYVRFDHEIRSQRTEQELDELRASKIMADRVLNHPKIEMVWDTVVQDILDVAQDKVTAVLLRNVKTNAVRELPCTGVFVAIGHVPSTKIFAGQIEMDADGYVLCRQGTYTNIPGVFAAGDCVDRTYRQAITAAGSGCAAAIDAERWLSTNH